MTQYFSPGVYIQEVPPQLRAIEGVSTSIAGLVGVAARGPVAGFPLPFTPGVPTNSQPFLLLAPPDPSPVLVTSLPDYTRKFGPLPATPSTNDRNFLGHAVRAFFDNGGQQAYVARIIASAASRAFATLDQGAALRLTAKAKSGTSVVALDSLRGINGGNAQGGPSTLQFTTPSSPPATYTVVAYNTQSGTVTLSSNLTQDYNIEDTFVTVVPPATTLSGTVTVTQGTTGITFVPGPQTISTGATIEFSSEPGVQYTIAAPGVSGSSGTLTNPYEGLSSSTATATVVDTALAIAPPVEDLAVLTLTNGSPNITFALAQTLPAGTPISFSTQPGVTYYLQSAISSSTAATITPSFTGTSGPATATVTVPPQGPMFYARSPGSWGNNVQVLVSNSDQAPTQITASAIASNVIQVQTTASFYPGAILEIDYGGGNGGRDYVTVVQTVSGTRVQVDRSLTYSLPPSTPTLLTGNVAVSAGSASITFVNPQNLPAGTPLIFGSQPGVQYVLAAPLQPGTHGTLTTDYGGATNNGTTATVPPISAFARVVEIDVTIVDTVSGTTETYERLTWGVNTGVWSAIQSSVQSRHYANVINTQSALVYVQPPGMPVVPATADLPGTEAFSVSSSTIPLSYQPQSFNTIGALAAFAFPQMLSSGGSEGNSLGDPDFVGVDNGPGLRTGIQALQDVGDISIIAVPGETANDIQQALITQCEYMRYRFAVLDGQLGPPNDTTTIVNHRNNYASSYAGYYVPWVQIDNGVTTLNLPPSGYIMGIYARVDNSRGVWKAPANEPVQNVTGLQSYITKGEQDILNPVGVNCVRRFPGRGILVWGARTLSADPQFKYVNVRRYLIFLEASLDRGTQWVVFEPNSPPTWSRVVDSVTAFLNTQWRAGALFGLKAEDAFYVRCDETTMSADDIQNGRLICDIGVAIVRPAEFVIFRIEQITGFSPSNS